jgi:hypothetical protein
MPHARILSEATKTNFATFRALSRRVNAGRSRSALPCGIEYALQLVERFGSLGLQIEH